MGRTKKNGPTSSINSTDLSRLEQKLTIEYRDITSLRPDPRNPRRHNELQVQQIAKSIGVFGFNVPILINAEMQVIAGHGRLEACKLLGAAQVPTIRLEHLTDTQEKAFMVADNKLTDNSEWDNRLLGEQLRILSAAELDFTLGVIGFELREIDFFIENLAPATKRGTDPADAIPDSRAKPQVTQSGSRWVLNRHRVYCGDARTDSTYPTLMEGHPAEMVFTAPPYGDPNDGYVIEFEKGQRLDNARASDEINSPGFIGFFTNVAIHLRRHTVDGAFHYICIDWRRSAELLAVAGSVYPQFENLCVWVKEKAGQGSLYRSQHELVFVFRVGKKPHQNHSQSVESGRHRSNVWNYRRVAPVARNADDGIKSTPHSKSRPVELVADAILDCTARGDIVLDPFLGSGSTVIAAERTGRVCYGVEINPHSVDTIVRRWQAYTGQSAVEETTGKTFNKIEEENHDRTE
jgi:DNA modification methylase